MKKIILVIIVFLIAMIAQAQKDTVSKGDTAFSAAMQTVYDKYSTVAAAGKYTYGLSDEQISQQMQAFIRILNEAIIEWNNRKQKRKQ
jgi:outer membrane lipoprotein-sorting protein